MAYAANRSRKLVFFHVHSITNFHQIALIAKMKDSPTFHADRRSILNGFPNQHIIENDTPRKLTPEEAKLDYIENTPSIEEVPVDNNSKFRVVSMELKPVPKESIIRNSSNKRKE